MSINLKIAVILSKYMRQKMEMKFHGCKLTLSYLELIKLRRILEMLSSSVITDIIHRRDDIYRLFNEKHHDNNYYKRFLYCDTELLIIEIDAILCSYSSDVSSSSSSNNIVNSNLINNTLSSNEKVTTTGATISADDIEIIKTIKDKLNHDIINNCNLGYINRKKKKMKYDNNNLNNNNNGNAQQIVIEMMLYIIDKLDQLIRLTSVWLFLIIASIFIAIPCILFTPVDYLLVKYKILPVYHQISVLLTVFTAQTILRLSGIALVLHGKLIIV